MPSRPLVIKRNGSVERFSQVKIIRVLNAAGLPRRQAALLARRVLVWAIASHLEKISSLAIRDQIIKELENINKSVAGMYRWYQKTKELPHIIPPQAYPQARKKN